MEGRNGGELPPLAQCCFACGATISGLEGWKLCNSCSWHVGGNQAADPTLTCMLGSPTLTPLAPLAGVDTRVQTAQAAIFAIIHSKRFSHHNISSLLYYLPKLPAHSQPTSQPLHFISLRLILIPPVVAHARSCLSSHRRSPRTRRPNSSSSCSSMTHTLC